MFNQAVLKDQHSIESEVMRRAVVKEEVKRNLDKQLAIKQTIAEMEKENELKAAKTNFGPEENAELYNSQGNRRSEAKVANKHDLIALMKEKEDRHKFIDKLERSLDMNMVDQQVQAYYEEQKERKALDAQRK